MNRYPQFPTGTPSTTEVLKDVGLVETFGFNQYAMDRGSKVHRACQYLDEGDLDMETVSDSIRGYVNAYQRFKTESGMAFDGIEVAMYSADYGYCGTADRINRTKRLVLDLKTGQPQAWHGFQLASYSILAFNSEAAIKRYGLCLKQDGAYSLKEYKDRRDFQVWAAALTIFRAKRGL